MPHIVQETGGEPKHPNHTLPSLSLHQSSHQLNLTVSQIAKLLHTACPQRGRRGWRTDLGGEGWKRTQGSVGKKGSSGTCPQI